MKKNLACFTLFLKAYLKREKVESYIVMREDEKIEPCTKVLSELYPIETRGAFKRFLQNSNKYKTEVNHLAQLCLLRLRKILLVEQNNIVYTYKQYMEYIRGKLYNKYENYEVIYEGKMIPKNDMILKIREKELLQVLKDLADKKQAEIEMKKAEEKRLKDLEDEKEAKKQRLLAKYDRWLNSKLNKIPLTYCNEITEPVVCDFLKRENPALITNTLITLLADDFVPIATPDMNSILEPQNKTEMIYETVSTLEKPKLPVITAFISNPNKQPITLKKTKIYDCGFAREIKEDLQLNNYESYFINFRLSKGTKDWVENNLLIEYSKLSLEEKKIFDSKFEQKQIDIREKQEQNRLKMIKKNQRKSVKFNTKPTKLIKNKSVALRKNNPIKRMKSMKIEKNNNNARVIDKPENSNINFVSEEKDKLPGNQEVSEDQLGGDELEQINQIIREDAIKREIKEKEEQALLLNEKVNRIYKAIDVMDRVGVNDVYDDLNTKISDLRIGYLSELDLLKSMKPRFHINIWTKRHLTTIEVVDTVDMKSGITHYVESIPDYLFKDCGDDYDKRCKSLIGTINPSVMNYSLNVAKRRCPSLDENMFKLVHAISLIKKDAILNYK